MKYTVEVILLHAYIVWLPDDSSHICIKEVLIVYLHSVTLLLVTQKALGVYINFTLLRFFLTFPSTMDTDTNMENRLSRHTVP